MTTTTATTTTMKLVDFEPCEHTEVAITMLTISGQTDCCEVVRVPVNCREVVLSNKFPELKEYPLGLPVLVLDAKTALFGTTVINSFLAQKLGLGGKSVTELALCASVDAAVMKACEGFMPKMNDLATRMAAMKEWTECGYFEWLKKLDTYVATQCGPSGFLVGDQLTYADLVVADLLEETEMHMAGSIDKFKTLYPALHSVYAKANADERVKSYKEKRGPRKMPDECWKAFEEARAMCACCASGGKTAKADCGCCDTATGKTMACCTAKSTTPGSCCATAGATDTKTGGAAATGTGTGTGTCCTKECTDKAAGEKDDCGCCGGTAIKKGECPCGTTCPCK